jgi:hypothetical protein
MINYVFLCDSPELDSGFANVGRNLLSRIQIPEDSKLFVWGLGHDNIPTDIKYQIYSAGINSSWRSEKNINRFYEFLNRLEDEITLIVIHDAFRLSDFCPVIDKIRLTKKLNIIAYVPVDSYLTIEDQPFLSRVDIPVAYNEFGKKEIQKYALKEVIIIPHGLEHETYKPLDINRERLFPQLTSSDKLIINVNTNTERKSPEKSIEILKELLQFENNYFLYMHMHPHKDTNLKEIATDLGVEKNIIFADPFYENTVIGKTSCSKELLCEIYNCADLVLSTSVGEGWGLTSFEAAACKVPIAIPYHTSYKELFTSDSCIFLPTNNTTFFMKKTWPVVDVKTSATLIHNAFRQNKLKQNAKNAKFIADGYCWDKVALEWNKVIRM